MASKIFYECGCMEQGDQFFHCAAHKEPDIRRMPKQKPGKSKQDYGTPPDLLAAVKQRLCINEFVKDLAASPDNAVCPYYYTEEINSLSDNIGWNHNGWCWLNPPFAKIQPWVKKASEEATKGAHITMLVPASVGSVWWYTYVEPYAYVSFLSPRLTFVGETTPYPKDCALLLYTPWGFTGHEIWYWKDRARVDDNGAPA